MISLSAVVGALLQRRAGPPIPGYRAGDPTFLAGQTCGALGDHDRWTLTAGGQLVNAATGLCATAQAVLPVPDGTTVAMAACAPGDAKQEFVFLPGNSSLVLAGQRGTCLNLAGYGTSPGTSVWLFSCSAADCKGNCDWSPAPVPVPAAELVNSKSGLCLQDGTPPPPLPHTCETGSPAYDLPFCDPALPVDERVADLLARLDTATKIQQFSIPVSHFVYNSTLNLKGFLWDLTCMRGISPGALSPNRRVTVFPHASGLAATFDLPLYSRIGSATQLEGRIINQMNYEASGGTSWQGVHCDGGPLANTQHDPRWGRVSETYGEDPVLSAAMGVAANRALQNRSADRRWLASSQVTRHYLGYHGANDLPRAGEELIDLHGFADQQEGPYSAFQARDGGDAEGIMMAMSAFSIGRRADWGTPAVPMIPSLVHPYLWAKLRDEWRSDCFAQTDCCDSITTMVDDHKYFPDMRSAVSAAVEAGLQASYGPNAAIDATLAEMLADGSLDAELFDTRIARTLLTRFRLGEFDAGRNPDFPYAGPYNETALDGPAHRALAREAAAASVVLLKNVGGRLPLTLAAGDTLAVVGPFANCSVIDGGYGSPEQDAPLACSYLHSYSGYASAVSTIVAAAAEEGARAGFSVTYAQGSNILTPFDGAAGLAAAVSTARAATVTLLVVGLSSLVEAEGRDRANVTLPAAQQALVDAVAAAVPASRIILVVVAGGGVDTSYEQAAAAVHYMYPGEEAGTGLFDVLTGRMAPSGRLPLTVYRHAYLDVIEPLNTFTLITQQGTGRTYRYVNDSALVHYYFGHGLSYASFAYSALTLTPVSPAPGPGAPADAPLVQLSVLVQNVGAVPATEVVQVYVTVPRDAAANASVGGAPLPLRGLQWFTKLPGLLPGAAPTLVTATLPVGAFRSTTAEGGRLVTGGVYAVSVAGHMSDDPTDGPDVAGSSNVVTATIQLPVIAQHAPQ